MARDRSTHENRSDDSDGSPLRRRSFLKAAGGAVAASTALTAATRGTAATTVDIVKAGADDTGSQSINGVLQSVHGNDTEIYFPPGTYRLDPVSLSGSNWTLRGAGQGETILEVPNDVNGHTTYLNFSGSNWEMDGFTVDLSAPDAAPINHLKGRDWAFRNVHMKGRMGDPQSRKGTNLFYPATERGSTGLMENVSMPDGSADAGSSSNRGGMWFGPNNEGHLILRGLHMEGFANNTLYGAASAGPLTIEDCVFKNTNVGARIGGNTTVRNSVWVQDGPVPAQRWSGGRAARGLWISSNGYVPGDILIQGCEFVMTGPHATTAIYAKNRADDVTVRDTRIEQSNGRSAISLSGGGNSTLVENVSVTGDSSAPAFDFDDRDGSTFRNVCIQQPGQGISLSGSANSSVVDSTVNVGGQAFRFLGSSVDTSGISQNGTCPLPATEPGTEPTDGSDDGESTPAPDLPNTLSISGNGLAKNHYSFEVDGELTHGNSRGGTVNPEDEIDGSTATGFTRRGTDSYRFSGSVIAFDVEGDADVYLNGERIDPVELGSEPVDDQPTTEEPTETPTTEAPTEAPTTEEPTQEPTIGEPTTEAPSTEEPTTEEPPATPLPDDQVNLLSRTLRIEGAGGKTDYAFTVDGHIDHGTGSGANVNEEDEILGNTAWGFVRGGTDEYVVRGTITFFELDGDATVSVDGTEVDPSALGDGPALPHVIVFDGTGTGESQYRFSASGDVRKSAALGSIDRNDAVSGATVSGAVVNDVDAYRFSGDITDLNLVGDATVEFED